MTKTITSTIQELNTQGLSISDIATKLNKSNHYIRNILYRLKTRVKPISSLVTATTPKINSPALSTDTSFRGLIPDDNGYIDSFGYGKDIIKAFNYDREKETGKEEKLNFLLVGETGTGKTQLGVYVAHKLKLPLWEYTFNGETSTDNLLGYKDLIVDDNGKNKTIWIDGILTKAFRHGGVLLLNEINTINNSVAIKLFSALEKGRKLMLDDNEGEIITGHKDLLIIGTMNEGTNYSGTNDMNIALLSRFNQKIVMTYCSTTEKTLIKRGLIHSEKLLEIADKQRHAYYNFEYKIPISTRDLIILTKQILIYGEENAYNYFFNNFRTPEEKESIKELFKLHLSTEIKTTTKED